MLITREQFDAAIIAQDDDEDYEESGYVICVFPDGTACIGRYSHCSCYGTFDALCGGGVGDYCEEGTVSWDWQGGVEGLIEMARQKLDPAMPERIADSEDYDFDHLCRAYEQVLEWSGQRRQPEPKGRAK